MEGLFNKQENEVNKQIFFLNKNKYKLQYFVLF